MTKFKSITFLSFLSMALPALAMIDDSTHEKFVAKAFADRAQSILELQKQVEKAKTSVEEHKNSNPGFYEMRDNLVKQNPENQSDLS